MLDRHYAGNEGHPRSPKPQMALNELRDCECMNLLRIKLLDSSPFDSVCFGGSASSVPILRVEESVESEVAHPWQPPFWAYELIDLRLHHYRPREVLPRPPQVRFELGFEREVVGGGGDGAVMEDDSGGLAPPDSSLSCDDALLVV